MLNIQSSQWVQRTRPNNTTVYPANSIIGNTSAEKYWKFTKLTQGNSKGSFVQTITVWTNDSGLKTIPDLKVWLISVNDMIGVTVTDQTLLPNFVIGLSAVQPFGIFSVANVGSSSAMFTNAIYGDVNLNLQPLLSNMFTFSPEGVAAVIVTPYSFTPQANSVTNIYITTTTFK